MDKRFVYADNSATTKISKPVLDAMMPYLTEHYGNASSIYSIGMDSARAVLKARETVAKAINANTTEIYFTSGGSESDNWAIKCAADLGAKKGKKHIITTVFEHHAVLHTCQYLEKHGFDVTYVPVDPMGLVHVEDIEKAMRDDTCLVTVMFANNEIGTIQPIKEIGAVCRERKILFHTDAVQAIGNVKIDVAEMNIDLLSMSGHKIHAPKGVGAMYMRTGVNLPNLIHGGAQERSKRAGTENVAGIVGLAKAVELCTQNIEEKQARLSKMRDRIIAELLKIPESRLNGDPKKRLAGNVNISFRGIEGESLLLSLDLEGICASSGSACTSGSLDPSHVLLAIGLPHSTAHGSLRISLSDENTEEDADYIIEKVPKIVEKLRAMSPLWERILRDEDIDAEN